MVIVLVCLIVGFDSSVVLDCLIGVTSVCFCFVLEFLCFLLFAGLMICLLFVVFDFGCVLFALRFNLVLILRYSLVLA